MGKSGGAARAPRTVAERRGSSVGAGKASKPELTAADAASLRRATSYGALRRLQAESEAKVAEHAKHGADTFSAYRRAEEQKLADAAREKADKMLAKSEKAPVASLIRTHSYAGGNRLHEVEVLHQGSRTFHAFNAQTHTVAGAKTAAIAEHLREHPARQTAPAARAPNAKAPAAAKPQAPHEMTPKQYHEAEVRRVMAEYHIPRKEAEQYGVIDSNAEHFRAVHDHLRAGGTIAPKVLDALTAAQRRSILHDFPGRHNAYTPPEARKANQESEAANRAARRRGRETANKAAAQRSASPTLTHTGLVRRDDRVRSNGDARRFVSREIHSFRDAEGNEYRKSFEAPVGVHVSVPARATLADYNDLEARSRSKKAG